MRAIRTHKTLTAFAATLCLAAAAGVAAAATLTGTVGLPDGAPIDGAIVTLTDQRGISASVYTNAQGRFRLTTDLDGELQLRVRKRYHGDERQALRFEAQSNQQVTVTLIPLSDPQALSDDHPSLSHFHRIAFDEDETALFSRPNFARDCLSCHSLGNPLTRRPRNAESWVPTVQRMHGYLVNADEAATNKRAEMLAAAFDGSLVSSRPEIPIDPLIYAATIHEWRLAGTVVPHDAEFAHGNGKIYLSEMFTGEILETDLDTGEVLRFKLPADGMPPGGAFTKAGLPAPYGLTVARAPHSLVEGKDGRIYLTDSIGSSITVFDPDTREFENFDVGEGAMYPHTVRVDKAGIVWFTIAFSNQVGRFDPATAEMRVITLPQTPSLSISGIPIPYGIAVSPLDGGIWYAKLASDKIGRIDPQTLEVREYDSPVRAPRRQRFDADGRLWVAGFSDGAVAKIDVDTWQTTIYRLPVYAPGEIPAPYALAVHPETQEIWVNDTMLDLVWRFLPNEERFIAYPLPLRGTYTRDFTFTDKGWVCTSNNPIPAPALEGGVPELICIDPGDGATL